MQYKTLLFYSLLVLLSISTKISSQSRPDNFKVNTLKIGIAEDSLLNKSFKELKTDFYKTQQDSSVSKLIAKYYVLKAKKEKDTAQVAIGFYYISKVSEDDLALKYIDSMILITKNINTIKFPTVAYLVKGGYLLDKGQFNLALNNYLIAQKHATEKKNKEHIRAIQHNIGLIKTRSGSEKEALSIFKENLSFFSTKKIQDKNLESYLISLFAISDTYLRLKEPDSAENYIKTGLRKSINLERQHLYNNFLGLNGIQNRMQGNYIKALDTLLKAKARIGALSIEDVNKKINALQIAKVLLKLKRDDEAIVYLKDIDSNTTANSFSPDESDTFSLLINHYKKKGDYKNQLKTLNRLIYLDSVHKEKNKHINVHIVRKYDTVLLTEERDTLIEDLKVQKSYSYLGLILFCVVIIILVIILLNYRRKQELYKKRFEQLINRQKYTPVKEVKKTIEIKKETNSIDLPEELINTILEGLTNFENKKAFLNPDIKMNTVATIIKTNGNYLSKVINSYKKKNFTNYINDLRIDFCVEKLTSDATFRKYSIKAIAEEVGFSSAQSFSRAFYRKTGLQPSYFMRNLLES